MLFFLRCHFDDQDLLSNSETGNGVIIAKAIAGLPYCFFATQINPLTFKGKGGSPLFLKANSR